MAFIKDRELKYTILVLIGAGLWGTVGLFSRPLMEYGMGSIEVANLKVLLSALIIALFMLFGGKQLFKIKLRDLPAFIIAGVIGISCTHILYVEAISMISLGMTSVLLYIAPVFVVIFSAILFKEKITKVKIIALVLATLGCFLTMGVGNTESLVFMGVVIAILSGLCYSIYSVSGKYIVGKYHPLTMEFYAFLIGGLAALPLMNFGCIIEACNTHWDAWIIVLVSTVLTIIIPYFLYNEGLKGLEAGKAGILACFEPLIASICGLIVYMEMPTPLALLGMLLIIAATIVLNLKPHTKTTEADENKGSES